MIIFQFANEISKSRNRKLHSKYVFALIGRQVSIILILNTKHWPPNTNKFGKGNIDLRAE